MVAIFKTISSSGQNGCSIFLQISSFIFSKYIFVWSIQNRHKLCWRATY